jgi:hypothetical protein
MFQLKTISLAVGDSAIGRPSALARRLRSAAASDRFGFRCSGRHHGLMSIVTRGFFTQCSPFQPEDARRMIEPARAGSHDNFTGHGQVFLSAVIWVGDINVVDISIFPRLQMVNSAKSLRISGHNRITSSRRNVVEGGPNSGHSAATKCRLRAPMVPKAKRF